MIIIVSSSRAMREFTLGVKSHTLSMPKHLKVLEFWYKGVNRELAATPELYQLWFQSNPKVDEEIKSKFEPLIEQVGDQVKTDMSEIFKSNEDLLASVIILDQFPRNIYRQTKKAFEYDQLSQALVREAIRLGHDKTFHLLEQQFFYMPLMHSENIDDHNLMLEICQKITNDNSQFKNVLDFEIKHFEIIKKFGRYPYRNKVLGRESTLEEMDYLKTSDSFGQ